jgi:preprotein translocase subunit Sec61beta
MLPLGGLDIRGPRLILYAGAALSLVAALIHLWVMPEHFEEW